MKIPKITFKGFRYLGLSMSVGIRKQRQFCGKFYPIGSMTLFNTTNQRRFEKSWTTRHTGYVIFFTIPR